MQVDLGALSKADLVRMAADAGLSTWGTKQHLIERLGGVDNTPASSPMDAIMLPCGCRPGESCGQHVPAPDNWPADLPLPDLESPVLAPPIIRTHVPNIPPMRDGELLIEPGQCFVAFRVSGRGSVNDGILLDGALVDLRTRALEAAIGDGVRARAPRLAAWLADPDGAGGRAVIAMTVKGG